MLKIILFNVHALLYFGTVCFKLYTCAYFLKCINSFYQVFSSRLQEKVSHTLMCDFTCNLSSKLANIYWRIIEQLVSKPYICTYFHV